MKKLRKQLLLLAAILVLTLSQKLWIFSPEVTSVCS